MFRTFLALFPNISVGQIYLKDFDCTKKHWQLVIITTQIREQKVHLTKYNHIYDSRIVYDTTSDYQLKVATIYSDLT